MSPFRGFNIYSMLAPTDAAVDYYYGIHSDATVGAGTSPAPTILAYQSQSFAIRHNIAPLTGLNI
jgi:hypothetical protein